MNPLYVQFGCGLSNPSSFVNYDSSPNLYLQRHFLLNFFRKHKVKYPDNVLYGDIVKGLPVKLNSIKGIYSSHVLEHLSYNDCRQAIINSYAYLQPGGIFRCVLPNLELLVKSYLKEKESGNTTAANRFMEYTFLGYKNRPKSLIDLLRWNYTYDNHFWMWDNESLMQELKEAGFKNVYQSGFGKSIDSVFNDAEAESRFADAICLEAIK